MTARSVAMVASGVAAVAVIALAYLLGTHTSHHHRVLAAALEPSPRAAPSAVHPGGVAAVGDPVTVATAWLRAYRGIQWTDSSPSGWVDRVQPYVGEALAAEYDQARQGSAGTSWLAFVRDKCATTVREVGGVIPPEAPRAPDSVYVQVAGTVLTECTTGASPMPAEPIAATVEVRRVAGGRWVVSRRLF